MKNSMWSDLKTDVHGSPLVVGVITAFLVSLLCTLVMAGVYTWSTLSEGTLPYTAYTINAVSALLGAILAARSAGARGWYYGGVSALVFSAILAIIGSLVDFSAAFQLETIVRIALLGFIGAFGGVIGVNLSNSSR
ncbi:MAG: TIGR04086 family membrane protein [Firmicutes bacterium]|nr:TIGR04086 family membrane protein [Bacillota bacterium]